MPESLLSALKNCIGFIQLKLSDFFGGEPSIDKVLTERLIQKEKPYRVNKGLILLANNHFELVNPVCPVCGSYQVTKQEYRRRTPILGEFGAQKVYLRRYRCIRCRKKFTTPLDSVVERNHRYASVFKDKVGNLTKTGYRSLRKLKEDLFTFFGISPSHQSIKNWVVIGDVKTIKNQITSYSGYYCYDEQYIKIDGKREYRLTLFDSLLNIPVYEGIARNRAYKTVYGFLKEALENKPLFAITTDHRREYKTIIDNLGAVHQLCLFHLSKMIGEEVYAVLRSKKASYRDKIKLCFYFTDIKNIFRTYDENVAIERLEKLLDEYDDVPRVLQGYIRKKILPDFERLTLFMRDGFVSKTTNPVENYYRQTDPDQIKKKFKTSQGMLSYLAKKMEYWTMKLGRFIQHPTS
jgi:transposase-like protein